LKHRVQSESQLSVTDRFFILPRVVNAAVISQKKFGSDALVYKGIRSAHGTIRTRDVLCLIPKIRKTISFFPGAGFHGIKTVFLITHRIIGIDSHDAHTPGSIFFRERIDALLDRDDVRTMVAHKNDPKRLRAAEIRERIRLVIGPFQSKIDRRFPDFFPR